MMSDVDGGGEIQTNAQAAITGPAKCGSSCLAQCIDGSRLDDCSHNNGAHTCPDDDVPGSTTSCLSGAPLIIDWRRRRCRDETVEESVRVGALNLVASKAPGTIGGPQSPTFIENGPAQTYKYTGSPVTSPTTIPTSPLLHSPLLARMTDRDSSSSFSNISPGKRVRNRDTNRHVTFSDPEISHVLITQEEPVYSDHLHSPVATVEKPLTIRRYYLAEADIVDQLRDMKSCYCLGTIEKWAEMYYDTPASSLCSLECILMKDTRASKYWKFFSFAEDNIMEITTDEKEINEPLSRLVPATPNGPIDRAKPGKSTDQHRRIIDSESLKSFFAVRNETDSFVTSEDGTYLKVTVTDYGFAWVVVERLCVDGDRLADITLELDTMAKALGLSNLASYDPMRYL